jgi:SAM-dependent methyltransferase
MHLLRHIGRQLLAAMFIAVAAASASAADKLPVNAGPYVPSPSSVVSDMLKLAEVGPKDFVIDLGSGDGRIVLTAAKVFGARGFGVDINEKLVKEANEAAKLQGIADRANFTIQDLFKTDIHKATVVTMYLLPNTVNMLKDKLLSELNPGTRILSHDYPLSGWVPEQYRQFDLEDKVAISGVSTTLIYLYVVPAKAEGTWSAKLPANLSKEPVRMVLKQQITRVAGTARVGGKDVLLEDGKLRGERFTFKLTLEGKSYDFTGTLKGGSIAGTVADLGGGTSAAWSAAPGK